MTCKLCVTTMADNKNRAKEAQQLFERGKNLQMSPRQHEGQELITQSLRVIHAAKQS